MTFTSKHYKIIGESILLIPTALLMMMGIGELIGSDASGWQHFLEIVPFIVCGWLCWKFPRVGGVLLVIISAVLSVYYFTLFSGFPTLIRALNDMILFIPPMSAGLFFIAAQMKDSDS